MGKVYKWIGRVVAAFTLLIGTGNSLKAQSNMLNFDGVDDQVNANYAIPSSGFTIEFWFRTNQQNCGIFTGTSSAGGFDRDIYLSGGDIKYYLYPYGVFSSTGVNFADSAWHFVSISTGSNGVRVSVDGILRASNATITSSGFSAQNQIILGRSYAFNSFGRVDLDEFKIWNIVRDSLESINSRLCSYPSSAPNLIVYYSFNQGTAGGNNSGITTVTSIPYANYNGTLSGFALSGSTSNWVSGSPISSSVVYPASPTVLSVSFVQNSTASPLTASGTNLLWYSQSTGGSSSSVAPTPSTSTIGSTSYYVTQSPTLGCESPRARIDAEVDIAATHLKFDGINDQITANVVVPTSNFTIEFWFKTTNQNGGLFGTSTSNYQGYDRDIYLSNGNLVYYLWNGSYNFVQTVGVNYSDGNWHHVAVTTGTGGTLLYVDGSLMQSNSNLNTSTFGNSTQINIGRSSAATNFIGTIYGAAEIDEFRIWNVVRTLGDINRTRYCSINASQTGLLANYTFNQGVNSRFNYSNNIAYTTPQNTAYNGTLSGFNLYGNTSNWYASSIINSSSFLPSTPSIGSQTFCTGAIASDLSPAISSTNVWFTSSSAWPGISSQAALSTQSYYAATINSYGCYSQLATSAVTVAAPVASPTVNSPVYYGIGATASALTATGSNLKWYTTASGGTASTSAPTPSTTAAGTTSYFVSQTINGCESSRSQLNVVVSDSANCLSFDGVNDWILSNFTMPTTNYTIEFWFKTSQPTCAFFSTNSTGGGYDRDIYLSGGNLVYYIYPYGTLTSTGTNWANNAWHHVMATTGSYGTLVYVDGLLTLWNNGYTASSFTWQNQIFLGRSLAAGSAGAEYGNMQMDEFKIWNYQRNITDSYRGRLCSFNGSESGLLLYYPFNQGRNSASNSTVNTAFSTPFNSANNGTLNNFALSGSTSNWIFGSPVVSSITAPAAPTVTSPVAYLLNANPTALSATGSNLFWYTAQTSSGVSNAPIPSTSTVGTTPYWVAQSNGGCEGPQAQINVNVYPIITGTILTTQLSPCQTPTGLINISSISSSADNVVNTDFSSLPNNVTNYGSAILSGGRLQLTSTAAGQVGGAVITNPVGIVSNQLTVNFSLITTSSGGTPADGISYSFADDGLWYAGESGSGSKLRILFDAYPNPANCGNGSNPTGIYLVYGAGFSGIPATNCAGVLAYSSNMSWCSTPTSGATSSVSISISATGLLTMTLNGTTIFSNVQLPASYLTADKSTWQHIFSARTGGASQGQLIDNLQIFHSNIYEYSFDNGTTWTTSTGASNLSPGTYVVKARFITGPLAVNTIATATVNPFNYTLSSTANVYCRESNATIYVQLNERVIFSITMVCQSSPKGMNNWTTFTTRTGTSSFPVSGLTQSMDYRAIVYCGSTLIDTTDAITINLSDSIKLTSNKLNIVLGDSINLSLAKFGTVNSYSYVFSANPSTGSGLNSPIGTSFSVTPTAVNVYKYSVVATDATYGCSYSDSVIVNVLPAITGSLTTTQITPCTLVNGKIQSNVVTSIDTIISTDFSGGSSNLNGYGSGFAISGGQMQLTPNSPGFASYAVISNNTGYYSNEIKVSFDLITTSNGGAPADGLAYSFCDDVHNFSYESGSGSKLRIAFDPFANTGGCGSGTNSNGIYLMYGFNTMYPSPNCAGVLAYSNNVSWMATPTSGATSAVVITINAAGQLTMTLNGTTIFNNVQLPASYLSANKQGWGHVFGARTGGLAEGHFIDNLVILNQGCYQYSYDNGSTWTSSSSLIPPTPGTYVVKSRYSSAPSIVTTLGTAVINPFNSTLSATSNYFCKGSTSSITISSAQSLTSPTCTFQSSVKGANSWTTIQSSSATSYTITSMSQSMDYRMILACGGTIVDTSDVITINVSDSLRLTTNKSVVFLGDSAQFSVVKIGTNNSFTYSYVATPSSGSGLSSANSTSISVTPTSSAAYNYVLTATDTSVGCVIRDSVTVTVIPTIYGSMMVNPIVPCSLPGGRIQVNATSTAETIFSSDFSTVPSNLVSGGNSFAITGGRMQLTTNVAGKTGLAIISNQSGIASNAYQVNFNLITTSSGGTPADGFSYSFGDDVTNTNWESGSGSKLRISFDAYGNGSSCGSGSNPIGIYVMYGYTGATPSPSCSGVYGYVANSQWSATASSGTTTAVAININSTGFLTLSLNGSVVLNVQLPSTYLSADKSSWKHAFAAGTGGLAQGHYVDDLVISQASSLYQYSFNNGTTWSTSNIITNPGIGTYPVLVRYAPNTAKSFNVGTAVINQINTTLISSSYSYCVNSTTSTTLTVVTPLPSGVIYTFYRSPKNANSWTSFASSASNTTTVSGITQSMDYKVVVTCGGIVVSTSNTITVEMATPKAGGTYTIGSSGNYPTLTAAFADISCGGISGPITFLLKDALYNSETFPIVIPQINGASSTNTITVRCSTGVVSRILGNADALFKLNGTDYITFDGSNSGGTDRSLTIENQYSAGPVVFHLASQGSGAGCTNVTVKNLNIYGLNTLNGNSGVGIYVGGSAIGGMGYDNDYLTVQNDSFRISSGVKVMGNTVSSFQTSSMNDSLIVRDCGFNYSTTSGEDVVAISINGIGSGLIKNNSIRLSSNGTLPTGIQAWDNTFNTIIEQNQITQVAYTGGYGGARGMELATNMYSGNANMIVRNNLVTGISGANSFFANGTSYGIAVGMKYNLYGGSANGIAIYNNTVQLLGNYSNMDQCVTAALYLGNSLSNITVKNNILVNDMRNTNSQQSKSYAVYSAASSVNFTTDYNDYYPTSRIGAQGFLGYLNGQLSTMSQLRTAFGSDANSKNVDPKFESTTSFVPNAIQLNDSAQAIGVVTTDILGNARSSTPDFGAYEFAPKLRTTIGDSVIVGTGRTPVSGNEWIHFYDASQNLIFSINPNGNNLDSTQWGIRVTNQSSPRWSNFLNQTTMQADTGYVMNRNFYITPKNQPTTPVTVRFYFMANELSSFVQSMNNRLSTPITNNSIYLTKFSGNSRSPVDLDPTNNQTMKAIPDSIEIVRINPVLSAWGSNYAMTFNVNSFSEFAAGYSESGSPIILPVELSSFIATKKNELVDVRWTTASEHNSAYFEVQRSVDGKSFETIGTIAAAGNSTSTLLYQFNDRNLSNLPEVVYYRLKQVDLNGKVAYSEVRTVRLKSIKTISTVYPVPATDQLTIMFNEAVSGRILVRNMLGQQVLDGTVLKDVQTTLDLTTLQSGVYMLEVQTKYGIEQIKFIKE